MILSGDGGEGLAECGEHRPERREGAGGELGRPWPERAERLPEEPRLQPRRHARERGDVAHQPLGRGARAAGGVRCRAGRGPLEAFLQQPGSRRLVFAGEELGDERRRLAIRQPGARDHLRRGPLVATLQLRKTRRRTRRQEPEPYVRLDGVVERLGQHEPPAHPALVPPEQTPDRRLVELVLAVERAHQPALLELGQPMVVAIVQRADGHLRVDGVDREGVGAQLAPAERPRGTQSLEAVDDLGPIVRAGEDDDCRQLTVPLERLPHRRQRLGLAQPQRAERLAEDLDAHHAVADRRRGLHGHHLRTLTAGRRGWRVTPRPRFGANPV